MIIDAVKLTDTYNVKVDICIVGAGAAGIAVAAELARSKCRVVLIESGGERPDKKLDDLFRGETAKNSNHPPLSLYRRRVIGGTTSVWGGRCVPFDEIDFEVRDYVPFSGWPIKLEELLPYYKRASIFCEAGPYQYTVKEVFGDNSGSLIQGFVSDKVLTTSVERFSKPTDFGKRYEGVFVKSGNVDLIKNTTCTNISLNESGNHVVKLISKTLSGRKLEIVADHYVLALGGLETPRLMLASNDVIGNGVGNTDDNVGRFYMCHLIDTSGTIKLTTDVRSVIYKYEKTREGVYCRRRFSISPLVQRINKIGNFIARLHYPDAWDPSHGNGILSSLFLAKILVHPEYRSAFSKEEWVHSEFGNKTNLLWPHLRNVLFNIPEIIGFSQDIIRRRIFANRKLPSVVLEAKSNKYPLDVNAEQTPNPNSRVKLATEKDRLGMPRIYVDWKTNELDLYTIEKSLEIIGEELDRKRFGCMQFDASSIQPVPQGGHHLGTTRMTSDIKEGVVDKDCRVHGVDNLFIAGSSVFPTSSHANPTLTIVALAMRLASYLEHQFATSKL